MKAQLVDLGIPGDGWDARVAAQLVGSMLQVQERSPGKLAKMYAGRLTASGLTDKQAAELLVEFQKAVDVYIGEQG